MFCVHIFAHNPLPQTNTPPPRYSNPATEQKIYDAVLKIEQKSHSQGQNQLEHEHPKELK